MKMIGSVKYLCPTDPAAAWNTKEGRGRFGYFTNYMVDTAHAVIVDVEATPARMAQVTKATKAMLDRIEERHGLKPARLAGLWHRTVSGLALSAHHYTAYSGAGSATADRGLAPPRGLHLRPRT